MHPEPEALLAARLLERAADAGAQLHLCRSEARAARLAAAAEALGEGVEVIHLPAPDAAPYDRAPPTPGSLGARLDALRRLRAAPTGPRLVLAGPAAAARRWPEEAPPPLLLHPGDALDPEALDVLGYAAEEIVDDPGEYALRGAVLDVCPALPGARPHRLERDEEGRILAIRRFHPLTQRSEGEAAELVLPPALAAEDGALLPLAALLPGIAATADPEAADALAEAWREAEDGFRLRLAAGLEDGEALREPAALFTPPKEAPPFKALAASEDEPEPLAFLGAADPEAAFLDAAAAAMAKGCRVALAGAGRRAAALAEALRARFGEVPECPGWLALRTLPPGSLAWVRQPLLASFASDEALVAAAVDILPAADSGPARLPVEEAALAPGDLVIHEEHGMARLLGLAEAEGADALRLEFAGGTSRLVPAEELDRIWRYGAEAQGVALDRPGGEAWAKRRAEAEAALAETARGLLDLLKERAGRTAPAWVPPRRLYARFCAGFAFELTPDQAQAAREVERDLARGRPMDRLVCGDVGFGKTEIALRAAACVALAGGQVAVLAPTTVLARQHLEVFCRRFAPLGVAVAGLSRLTPAREARQVRAGLAEGTLRVVVGTQAVLAKATRFSRLGLVVADEEQRFGTRQKTALRALAADAHVLAMTATPIPRSLQGAMLGMQSLSVLATPPARKRPVRTAIATLDDALIGEALRREARRGGQGFLVAPRIEDLAGLRARLKRAAPRLRVAEAHGDMPAAEADDAMLRFAEGRADVLLCTAIVETGLDVPRAGTMLITGAERFGLSQLHQLRGRVGRGGARGTCWLLTEGTPPPAAQRRLKALAAQAELGAGFAIAARDLDQRGAGDLLGEAQAGHVKRLGLELTRHLLDRALRAARGEAEPPPPPALVLALPAGIPADYVPEEALRLSLHARLGMAAREAALDEIAEEMADRFGPLPEAVENLLLRARLRLRARRLGVARLECGPLAVAARFHAAPPPVAAPLEAKEERVILRREGADGAAMAANAMALLSMLRRAATPP